MPVLIQHGIALLSSNFLTYRVLAIVASKKPIEDMPTHAIRNP